MGSMYQVLRGWLGDQLVQIEMIHLIVILAFCIELT